MSKKKTRAGFIGQIQTDIENCKNELLERYRVVEAMAQILKDSGHPNAGTYASNETAEAIREVARRLDLAIEDLTTLQECLTCRVQEKVKRPRRKKSPKAAGP